MMDKLNMYYMHCLLAGIFSSVAFSTVADVPLDNIVVVVENGIIMRSELDEKLREVLSQMRRNNVELPPQDILEKQVLERMILNKIQLQRAEQTGIRVDDETLNRTINNISKGNKLSLREFRNQLERDGFNYENFRENIRDEIMISRLRQRQVDNRISITSKEIDNVLMNQEAQGDTDTEYRLQHILVSLPEDPTSDDEEQARSAASKALEDIKTGQDFESVATEISDGQKALEGGELGWRKKNEIPTIFSDHVNNMQKGDISDLIQNSSGFHIIRLADIRNSEQQMITQTKVRHILIRVDELTDTVAAETRLKQLKTRLEGGGDFEKIAKAHSDDIVSAAKGGELGWSEPGKLVPEFENIMNQLEINVFSEPFETQFGWHLIQVLERREHDNTENNKRKNAADAIRKKRSEEIYQSWLRHMRDEAYVEYR